MITWTNLYIALGGIGVFILLIWALGGFERISHYKKIARESRLENIHMHDFKGNVEK